MLMGSFSVVSNAHKDFWCYSKIPVFYKKLPEICVYDDDYGCEERMPNTPKMAIVYLKDDEGNEKELKVSDDFLEENEIEEGSIWKWR